MAPAQAYGRRLKVELEWVRRTGTCFPARFPRPPHYRAQGFPLRISFEPAQAEMIDLAVSPGAVADDFQSVPQFGLATQGRASSSRSSTRELVRPAVFLAILEDAAVGIRQEIAGIGVDQKELLLCPKGYGEGVCAAAFCHITSSCQEKGKERCGPRGRCDSTSSAGHPGPGPN